MMQEDLDAVKDDLFERKWVILLLRNERAYKIKNFNHCNSM